MVSFILKYSIVLLICAAYIIGFVALMFTSHEELSRAKRKGLR
jgi:hypothetical protein